MQNKKIIFSLIFAAFTLTFLLSQPSSVYAEKDGGDIVFKDTNKLPFVLFSHEKHTKAGNTCEDCHDKIFQKKIGSTDQNNALNMDALKAGKYCGACHNGRKAFAVEKSCKKCHAKP